MNVRPSLSTSRNVDTAIHLFLAPGGEAECLLIRLDSFVVAFGEFAALSLLGAAHEQEQLAHYVGDLTWSIRLWKLRP